MLNNPLWLPLIFILHDFEELIIVPHWMKHHQSLISSMKRPLFGGITDSAILAIGVLEELIILIAISIFSQVTHTSLLYLATFIAYVIHLLIHLALTLRLRTYTPGLISAILQLPICTWMIYQLFITSSIQSLSLIGLSLLTFFLLFINLIIIHRLMNFFAKKF